MGSPCLNCSNRHPNCHSECRAYLEYSAQRHKECAERTAKYENTYYSPPLKRKIKNPDKYF